MNAKARLILLGAALAAALPAAGPAQAADRVIASSRAFVSPVEAYGGNVVWGEVALGRAGFAYFVRDSRGTRRLPLEDFVRQVDLGARRGGGTRAVFVRCRPRTACLVRSYDFRTHATRTVPSLLRLPGTEGVPSVWNDRFAFTRSGRGLFATPPLRAVTRAKTLDTDLRGSRLAYLTSTPNGPPDPNHGNVPQTTTLRVATLPRGGGRVRTCFIARARGTAQSDPVKLSGVQLTATHVLWLRRDLRRPGPNPGTIRRQRLPARGCPRGGAEEHSREILRLQSFAVDRGRLFYTTNNNVWEATDQLGFTR